MNDVKRKLLEVVVKSLNTHDSVASEEFRKALIAEALIPQQQSEYLYECKTDDERREYLATLLRLEPSAFDVVKSCMDDMLPAVSEEFRRGAAQAVLDRLKRFGFIVVSPEQTQFEIKKGEGQ